MTFLDKYFPWFLLLFLAIIFGMTFYAASTQVEADRAVCAKYFPEISVSDCLRSSKTRAVSK